jgi:hypothetical protein
VPISKVPTSSLSPALAHMAMCIAVAYKRFVDHVPMSIDRTLLRGVVRTLGSARASSVGKGEGQGSQAVEPNSYDSRTAGNNEV